MEEIMKKLMSLIVFCLMLTSFVQIVYGWGETQWVSMDSKLPDGWMIIKEGWDDYQIIDLNNAPYGTELEVLDERNLPTGWVSLGSDGWNGYNIRCLIHDTTPPTAPANLQYIVTAGSVILSWLASTDLVGVTGYNIYKDNSKIDSTKETTYTVTDLTPDTQYSFAVRATDAENESTPSVVPVKTDPDYESPTPPSNLRLVAKTSSSITVGWDNSSDNHKVAGYNVYLNGVKIASSPTNSYQITGLTPYTEYSFTVEAFDPTGNISARSVSLFETTSNIVSTNISYYLNDWGSGGSVSISIKNNSTTAIQGWTLEWYYSGNQKITNMWLANYQQSGNCVTVSNADFNATIPADSQVSFGFNITYSGTNTDPTSFILNGIKCDLENQAALSINCESKWHGATINWSGYKSESIQGYQVLRTESADAPSASTEISQITQTPSVTYNDLLPDKTYYIWVRVVDQNGNVSRWYSKAFAAKHETP
jgi:chitodextrinase